MILYFSGTGNSAYGAGLLAEKLNDEVVSIKDKIKNNDSEVLYSAKSWVFVMSVYAWNIPRVVKDWILKTEFRGNKNVYFVFTCGMDIGNAGGGAKSLCAQKKLAYRGSARVVMPENYIAMFKAPGKEEALKIIKGAEKTFDKIGDRIKEGNLLRVRSANAVDRLKSSLVNDCFYKLFVKSTKFYAKDSCTSCGLCVSECPLNNISLEDGKPVWDGNCTHCMACICKCPVEAIEYGKATKKKVRYCCPKK